MLKPSKPEEWLYNKLSRRGAPMRDELCTPSACGADSDVGWNVRSMLGASMASFKVGLDLVLLRCPWLPQDTQLP